MIQLSTIFAVIPCYNEAGVIRQTVGEVMACGYRVIVVDDCSADETAKQVIGLPVFYIKHKINLGQGAALQTGIDAAMKKGADVIVTFDADGQHDVNDIAGMLKKLETEKLDIVFGSRFLPGSKTNIKNLRRLLLKLGRLMNYFFTGILLSDAHNGLRVMNRHAASVIRLRENRMAHATEFLKEVKRNGLRYAEFPVHIRYTGYSIKKGQSPLNSVRIFFDILLNKIFD